ncbi:MAG: Na+/H+ antiporter subunit E [Thermodesulfobacteriota bacterium]|nr:Na+/H+ antiporter subunit E [Thermodesulfobacteriota bacterium]
MNQGGKWFGFFITFGVMFLFWILLSGLFNAFHLIAGGICSALVAFLSHDLLVKGKSDKILLKSWRLFRYIPWELWQIVLANIDVAYRVLHPKMPIDPCVIEFETSLRGDFALVTLANSITLTPGTITISVESETGKFQVHAISKESADGLLVDQTMQRKVADIFMES